MKAAVGAITAITFMFTLPLFRNLLRQSLERANRVKSSPLQFHRIHETRHSVRP